MPKIFISYRRAGSEIISGRIYDRLRAAFGADALFKDVDDMPPGKDFRGVLREAVAACDVMLVIIGPDWLTVTNPDDQRRLDDPEDFVRMEVRAGLERDDCLVIPVLVKGAQMPTADELPLALRELAFNHALEIRNDPDFHHDMDRLIEYFQEMGGANSSEPQPPPVIRADFDVSQAIDRFYAAYETGDRANALTILQQIAQSGDVPSVFPLDDYLQALEQETNAPREYEIIRIMARRESPKKVWAALQIFWQTYPGYDPDNLQEKYSPATVSVLKLLPPPFVWVDIPAGQVTLVKTEDAYDNEKTFNVAPFAIAKYPVTVTQYAIFVEAGGYQERRWWTEEGWKIRKKESWREPRLWHDERFHKADHPVVGVSWYEAVAFCHWLAEQTGQTIRLPTEAEWQWAAQGKDGRKYPWGHEWDCERCNNSVSPCNSNATTLVTRYEGRGDSFFGTVDMAGNVWEWCLTDYDTGNDDVYDNISSRALRGGSWSLDSSIHFRVTYHFRVNPSYRYSNQGLRIARSY